MVLFSYFCYKKKVIKFVILYYDNYFFATEFQYRDNTIGQWFSNFLHQVPPQKIFGFPSTTIMTNIKMQYKWLPTAPGVCSRCMCVCSLLCVCALWMG